MKKLKEEFNLFRKEEPLGLLSLLALIIFTILYFLYDSPFIEFLSLIFYALLSYYSGRVSVKLENR